MSTLQDDMQREALLDRISEVGAELREHVDGASDARHELYPLLYEANVTHGMSLAQLQAKTGLTRGRIHQIVNLVKAERAGDSTAVPEPPVEVEDPEPVEKKTGWAF